jgi:hypothetical protein|nr:MAG TPA: Gifsy-2 prophage ATP-binding sugar transporter-like barrel, 4 helix bundle.7A [Bacteriophage sp.]
MFSVYFYVGNNALVHGTMKYIPRQGEKVRTNGKLYKVIDVMYILEQGASSTVEVVIRMEKF